MASPLVSDALWSIIAPLLPVALPRPRGGRPRVPDRATLTGILFVLRTGIQWEMLPLEVGCGFGITCWRRLRDWQEADVWDALHCELLRRLRAAGGIDWSRACTDSASLAAKRGRQDRSEPADRGRLGTKRHLVADRNGTPLAFVLTGANTNDSMPFEELLDGIPPVGGKTGRPRHRPDKLHADKAYDHRRCQQACRRRGIAPRIARRGVETRQTLSRHRWVIERTFAWIKWPKSSLVHVDVAKDYHVLIDAVDCVVDIVRTASARFDGWTL